MDGHRARSALATLAGGLSRGWSELTLFRQFVLATSLVLFGGMLAIGTWVVDRIQNGVVQSVAATAALYTDSLIEPRVQELIGSDTLSPQNRKALDALLLPHLAGKSIVAFKVWKGDTIVYSSEADLIGRSFPASALRHQAWTGVVSAEFNGLGEEDDARERALNLPILEVYAPVRESGTNRIIALAETYEVALALEERLGTARVESWIVVFAATLMMLALQAAIVQRGSRTIDQQRDALNDRIDALSRLLRENETLRENASQANRRVTEMNERYLRRLGADLHDGPVQLLGTSLLRLDSLSHTVSKADGATVAEADQDIQVIRDALMESLEEIRNMSGGLAPSEIEKLSLAETLELVARRHVRRTGQTIHFAAGALPTKIPFSLKTCLYRFAQEGLNNAFRHANGEGQAVTATYDDGTLEVVVSDTGPGLNGSESSAGARGGQGLVGLRDRVESLGGGFFIDSKPGSGTCLKARFSVASDNHEPCKRPHDGCPTARIVTAEEELPHG